MLSCRVITAAASVALLAACSPEAAHMSAEEFRKPENAAALENALASCKLILPNDRRAATCREAQAAKVALDVQEFERLRREHILAGEAVGSIPRTAKPAAAPPAPENKAR